MNDDDGGPAFPDADYYGMTLRDYFAAAALSVIKVVDGQASPVLIGQAAYAIADAMLKERAK